MATKKKRGGASKAGRAEGGAKGGQRPKKRRLGMGLSGMLSEPVPVVVDSSGAGAEGGGAGAKAADGAEAVSAADTAVVTSPASDEYSSASPSTGGELAHIPVGAIVPSQHQPRQAFGPAAIRALAESISTSGLMQPVLVRPSAAGSGQYELIAGERRWRAAQEAGLKLLPALVRSVDEQTAAELGIVENLQREDLDAIEKADAFSRLQDRFGLTHQEIADRVGWTRAAVTNQIRLCELDEETRLLIQTGAISGGHGRALLSIAEVEPRVALAKSAVTGGWSVRELERRIRSMGKTTGGKASADGGTKSPRRAHLDDLEKQLSDLLGTRVRVSTNRTGYKGKMSIEFYDLDQFDGLLGRLGFTPR